MRQAPGELTRYVPHCVVERVVARVPHESMTVLQGAVLFADISGFVPRVERIARQGPGALERLQELLNAVFGHLIERTSRSGGDVLKFAGDALLAAWTVPGDNPEAAVLAAARCALAIQQQPILQSASLPELRDIRLRIGIATGPLSYSIVGREDLGLSLLPTGAPFQAMGQAAHEASPGEVVLDERARALLGARAVGDSLPGGFFRLRALVNVPGLTAGDALPLQPPGWAPSALRAFVPRTVLRRLDAGHAEWMAEVRPVSVLFINLKEPRLMLQAERSTLQRVTLAVQEALAAFEGHLNQVVTEDKGIVFACTFGLPPLTHENDAERALKGALAIGEALRAQGLRHGIGVTTGRAFCGTYGADSRCEYAVLGDVVNLSARLMQRAEDEVLCDEPTARATRGRVELEALPPVQLKGKSSPVALHRVLRNKPAGSTPAFDSSTWLGQQPLLAAYRSQLERGMVGREHEREQVRGVLDELAAGIGGALVLEADTGLGKSMLLSAILTDAAERELPCLVGQGDAIERAVAYRAWRPLLEALLTTRARTDAEAVTSAEPLREGLRESLADHPHGPEWEPLLADVLGLRLPENEVTRAMATEVRGENTHALLVHLLEYTLVRRPFVVAFDDAQWLDQESWRLLVEVRRRVPTVLVVLAGRGLEEVGEEYQRLLATGRTTRLELRPLEQVEAHTLVCRRLGVDALPELLAALLYEKAEGHPLFIEELAYSLVGLGVLRVEGGRCQLTVEPGRLRELHLPDTLQGAALSRMDQCSPQQQLVLKVASVVGRTFHYRAVHDVLPVERDLGMLQENLDTLV
ncbi:MAG TPA: adenylate/guanylate cyclase domain-containing protein, partial [Archangium sp.]|uniref:AAA family ATPase n=1 Tax=Archangium sp. TaxID=1872627 RepID=UPI002ED961AC